MPGHHHTQHHTPVCATEHDSGLLAHVRMKVRMAQLRRLGVTSANANVDTPDLVAAGLR